MTPLIVAVLNFLTALAQLVSRHAELILPCLPT